MGTDLGPYVPDLLLGWDEAYGEAKHQAIGGTLVFADVSGFTRLSERLAKKGGKLGAEQLTDVINDLFGELLAVAAGRGGEMLKYGGDATLLFFSGAGHEVRAVAAAMEMQQRLGEIGRVDTGAGIVRLRMSVGVHSGEVDLFVVGDSHRELVVAGPVTTRTLDIEGTAEAGEVLVSTDTADALPTGVLGGTKGDHVLVRRTPDAGPVTPARFRAPAEGEAERFVSAGLRDHLVGGVVDPEHRLVTQLFIHVIGLEDVLGRFGARAAADELDETMTAIQDSCTRFGVTFLASDIAPNGTKAIAVAGAPVAVEQPEVRAARAMDALVAGCPPLPVRVGLHSGHVFTGEVGPAFRRTYTTIGDVTNTTARVMGRAQEGEVLALASVADAVRDVFVFDECEPFMAKGKSEPLVPFVLRSRVEAVLDRARPVEDGGEFVGRADVLATVLEQAEGVRDGEGAAVEIAGDAGMGKTRLVDEVRRECDDFDTRRIVCEPYEQSTPWFAAGLLLAALLGIDGRGARRRNAFVAAMERFDDLADWQPLVATVVDVDMADTDATAKLSAAFRQQRTVAVVTDLLDRLITEPTIIVVDGAQWLDDPSRALFAELASTATAHRWLLIAAHRDESVLGGAAPIVSLGPLGEADAAELLRRTARRPLLPQHVDAMIEVGGGNPLFLTSIARRGLDDADELPDSVEAMLASEIDTLDPEARRLLRTAAVVGTTVDIDLLAACAELGADSPAAVAARVGDLVEPAGPRLVRFRQQLLRDVAYQGLPFRQRRDLHGVVADELGRRIGDEVDDRLGILSMHEWHARRLDRCWEHSRLAGERAAEKFAHQEAIQLLERAAAAARSLDDVGPLELAEVWQGIGEAAVNASDLKRASSAYRQARRHARDDPVAMAHLCASQARLAELEGSRPRGRKWLRRGLDAIDGLDTPAADRERARLLAMQAWTHNQDGRFREAIDAGERAVAAGTASSNRRASASAHAMIDMAMTALGHEPGGPHADQAIQLLTELGAIDDRAAVLTNLGGAAHVTGAWATARELFERARADNLAAGDLLGAGYATFNLCEILIDQGEYDEAASRLEELAMLFGAAEFELGLASLDGLRGRIALGQGRADDAERDLTTAIDYLDDHGMRVTAHPLELCRVEALVHLGRLDDAEAQLERTRRSVRPEEAPGFLGRVARLAGWLALARGDATTAEARFDDALADARTAGTGADIALALEALNVIGPDAHRAADARALCDELGVRQLPGNPPVGVSRRS